MSGAQSRSRTVNLMANVSPFDALSPARLEELAATVTERHLERGEILIREGEQGSSVFVVISGRLRAYVHDGNETPVVVGEISAGESVGEMALLSDQPRNATVQAVSSCQLYELSRRDVDALCEVCVGAREALLNAAEARTRRESVSFSVPESQM